MMRQGEDVGRDEKIAMNRWKVRAYKLKVRRGHQSFLQSQVLTKEKEANEGKEEK